MNKPNIIECLEYTRRKWLSAKSIELQKKSHGAPKGNKNAAENQRVQNEPIVSTAAKIGKEFGKPALISPFLKPLEWKGNEFQSEPEYLTVITEEPAIQELKPWERPLRVIQT